MPEEEEDEEEGEEEDEEEEEILEGESEDEDGGAVDDESVRGGGAGVWPSRMLATRAAWSRGGPAPGALAAAARCVLRRSC